MAFFKIYWIRLKIKRTEARLQDLLVKDLDEGLTNSEQMEADILADDIRDFETEITALGNANLN